MEKVKNIIKTKNTKICLAADHDNSNDLFKTIEELGSYICILKLHYDIIKDFNDKTIEKLIDYKKKYNFLIWEDRKFADIGYIMEKQINNHIIKWADLISVHPIAGLESVQQISAKIGIILIGELSSTNNLINSEYKNGVINIANKMPNVIGIVCQSKMTDYFLNIVPGISLSVLNDNKGQSYNTIDNRKFADIFVIGRSILTSKEPVKTIEKYIEITSL